MRSKSRTSELRSVVFRFVSVLFWLHVRAFRPVSALLGLVWLRLGRFRSRVGRVGYDIPNIKTSGDPSTPQTGETVG